jgi:hypothetical protein
MAVFRVFDTQVIPEEEFRQKEPEIVRQHLARASGTDAGPSITLGSGQVFGAAPTTAAGNTVGFEPVGQGKPITIDIRKVYSGKVGTKSLFDGTGDIAVASGVKNWGAFKASARGLNWVARKTGRQTLLESPSALADGTTVIAAQKAVVTRQLSVTLELAAAEREGGIFDTLGAAFQQAAGIPLFMPQAGFLLAAGQLVPAVGNLLKALTGGRSSWDETAELSFGMPGLPNADAGLRIVAAANAGLDDLAFDHRRGLLNPDGTPYNGDEPYVVLAVDGRFDPEMANFTPAVASADLTRRFFNAQSGLTGVIDELLDLAEIVSDVKFRDQALALQKQMTGMSGTDKAEAQKRLEALVKNIANEALKP